MSRRIAVIGAGAIGTCCALALQKDGNDVVLLDPVSPGEGTSSGNAGVIANNMCLPLATPDIFKELPQMLIDPHAPLRIVWPYLPMLAPWLWRFSLAARPRRVALATAALAAILEHALPSYRSLLEDVDAPDLIQQKGWLAVYQDAKRFNSVRNQLEAQRQHGVRIEELSAEEVRIREPTLAHTIRHAYFYPDCAHTVNPLVLVQRLAQSFVARGGELHTARVAGVENGSSGLAIETDRGTYRVDSAVIAAGIWSGPLAASAGARVPLESERGYSVTIADPGITLNGPILSGDFMVGLTPMQGRLRVAGTVELASLSAPPNYARADMLLGIAQRLLPGLKASSVERWMGHRPSIPDSLPVIGSVPSCPNVHLAFGHGHLGITLAAITGELIADSVAGRAPQIDVRPFRPERFGTGNRTG